MRASDLYHLLQRRRGPRPGPLVALGLALSLALWLGSSMAADPKDRDVEQLRRVRAQVQQLQQATAQAQEATLRAQGEKAALAAELQKLQAGAAQQRQTAVGATRQVQALTQSLAAAEAERDQARTEAKAANEQLTQARSQVQQQQASLAQARQAAQEQAQGLAGMVAEQGRVGQQLATCQADNFSLVTIAHELADRITGVTLFGRAAASEPLFQLRRVQLENLAQTYRDRAEGHRLAPQPAAHARTTP